MEELQESLRNAVKELFEVEIEPELTRPEEQFGDFSTNIAMQLAGKLERTPREIAHALATKVQQSELLAKTEIADPGFINFTLTDTKLAEAANKATELQQSLSGQEIVLEHTDPNPFKEFHIGHAYSNTVGVAIGNLLKAAGASVHQVTYQGDVGLHIAMAIYSLRNNPDLSTDLGKAYSEGSKAYRDDSTAKEQIEKINTHLYSRDDPEINRLYDEGRQKSLEAFEKVYQKLGAVFEKNFFESDTAKEGIVIVQKNLGKVFTKSEGAIIYDGEKAGLHKRVFITKQGLPTYETKEIGLAYAKARDYPAASKFIVITANEIADYFKVLVVAINEIDKQLAAKIQHISHGVVKLSTGKMSSRTGEVVTLTSLAKDIEQKVQQLHGDSKNVPETVLGSMKYEFLKHRIGQDIVYDIAESVSLEGNSGPYLQYAHARARSILTKAGIGDKTMGDNFELGERSLARKISEYPEVVATATTELMPHHICTYLYELAQAFNRFYEENRVLGDSRQELRLGLVAKYSGVLKHGLGLINIAAPEKL